MFGIGVDFNSWTLDRKFNLGTKAQADNDFGNAWYAYVKLKNETATVAGVSGDPVAYLGSPDVSVNNDEYNTVVLDVTDAAASTPVCAGFLNAAVAGVAGTEYFGWVQITGLIITATALGGGAADGDSLRQASSDKLVQKNTATDHIQMADTIDASANLIRLRCPM